MKSAAYVQTWAQKSLSPIRFDIAHKRAWYAETNTYATEAARSADIYVLCVFAAIARASANPRDPDQWFFLACRASLLNERFPTQKTVALSALERLGLARLKYDALDEHIRVLGTTNAIQPGLPLRAWGWRSQSGHDPPFGPQVELPLERPLHLDCCHSLCAPPFCPKLDA